MISFSDAYIHIITLKNRKRLRASKSPNKKQLHGRRSTQKQKIEERNGNKSLESLHPPNWFSEITSETLNKIAPEECIQSVEQKRLLRKSSDTSSSGKLYN